VCFSDRRDSRQVPHNLGREKNEMNILGSAMILQLKDSDRGFAQLHDATLPLCSDFPLEYPPPTR
jgi:hypothetical protein